MPQINEKVMCIKNPMAMLKSYVGIWKQPVALAHKTWNYVMNMHKTVTMGILL
jgi:hypothetical protein